MSNLSKHHLNLAIVFIIGAGIFCRLMDYGQNESFWIDEGWRSVEILGRSWQEILSFKKIFHDLPISSLGFDLLLKLCVTLWGNCEYVLRLVPLLSGVLSVICYWLMARRFGRSNAVLSLTLLALSGTLIYYSSEVKQYSGDILVTILLYIMVWDLYHAPGPQRWLRLILAGVGGLWLSNITILVLAGFWGSLALASAWKKSAEWNLFLCWAALVWGLGGTIIWDISYKTMLGNQDIVTTFSSYFLPAGGSVGKFIWMKADNYLQYPFGGGVMTVLILLASGLWGAYIVWGQQRFDWMLLMAPGFLLFCAVLMGKYPLDGRLLLWTLPAFFIFVGAGLGSLRPLCRGGALTAGLLVFILLPTIFTGYRPSHYPRKDENRQVLMYMKKFLRQGDSIVMNRQAQFTFWYYVGALGLRPAIPGWEEGAADGDSAGRVIRFTDETTLDQRGEHHVFREILNGYDGGGNLREVVFTDRVWPVYMGSSFPYQGRFWLFVSDLRSDVAKIRGIFERHGKLLGQYERDNAAVYLYDLTGSR